MSNYDNKLTDEDYEEIFQIADSDGNIAEYTSYQGFTLQFKVTTSGLYLTYTLTGFASQTTQSSMPILRIPEVSGIVQPSAIVEGLAKAVKADSYYNLDIDHNDAPTLVQHGAMNTSWLRRLIPWTMWYSSRKTTSSWGALMVG